jgi:hypothetical protein
MVVEWDDLPTIENAGRVGRSGGASKVAEAYSSHRKRPGMDLGSLHFSLGADAMRLLQDKVFPSSAHLATLASPAAVQYTTYSDCGPFHYGGGCNNPCFGYAPDHMSTWYCATCAEQAADPARNPSWNWHFVGNRGTIQYMDQPSNPCAGKDAWKWKVGACGNCHTNAIFRCHDGYKQQQNGGLEPTICQGLISCDDQLTHCP